MDPDEPELSPQQAERVRRLLAEARHDEPIPDDVAARLDRVIAGLAEEPEAPSGPVAAPVVRLAERRRRAGRLLLAAAVVVVGGVAVGQLVDGGGAEDAASSGDAASTAESQAEGLPAPDRDDGSGDSELANGEQAPGAVSANRQSISRLEPQRLRSARFSADALALRDPALGRRSGAPELLSSRGEAFDSASCSPGTWGGGRYLRVSVDRDPGWLVYRPPRGDTQVVDLFLCGEDTPERSATLPFD